MPCIASEFGSPEKRSFLAEQVRRAPTTGWLYYCKLHLFTGSFYF